VEACLPFCWREEGRRENYERRNQGLSFFFYRPSRVFVKPETIGGHGLGGKGRKKKRKEKKHLRDKWLL